jgi:hypothetical protein
MRIFTLLAIFFLAAFHCYAVRDSSTVAPSVIVIPYMPAMHLSDSDPDIATESEMEMPEMRSVFRNGIVKALNKDFAEVYDVKSFAKDYVREADRTLDAVYHSMIFETDSTYPSKYPKRFAVKDTITSKLKDANKLKADKHYINIAIADQSLLPDLSEKFHADYFIFLNEIDIKTHFDDCLNLALKIYRRDIKIHYSIFDKTGKQVYGDVAVSHFDSNANNANEIVEKNFPQISDYILESFKRSVK